MATLWPAQRRPSVAPARSTVGDRFGRSHPFDSVHCPFAVLLLAALLLAAVPYPVAGRSAPPRFQENPSRAELMFHWDRADDKNVEGVEHPKFVGCIPGEQADWYTESHLVLWGGTLEGSCRVEGTDNPLWSKLTGTSDWPNSTTFTLEVDEVRKPLPSETSQVTQHFHIVYTATSRPGFGSQGTATFVYTYECRTAEGQPCGQSSPDKQVTGTVPWDLTVWDAPATPAEPYRLTLANINNDPTYPMAYQPYSFLITLEELDATGAYKRAAGRTLRFDAVDHEGLWGLFQASNCANCAEEEVRGKGFARLDLTGRYCVPECIPVQGIQLKTDAQGQAWITFYLDLAKLAQLKQVPAPGKPLTKKFKVVYETGTDADKQTLAQAETQVSLETVGIVEKIRYMTPTHHDADGKPLPDSEITTLLSGFTSDPGTQDGSQTVRGSDRIRFTRPAQGVGPALGRTVREGDLLQLEDVVTMNACGLPESNVPLYGGPFRNAALALQMRYFDGVRLQIIVKANYCRESFTVGKAFGEATQGLADKAFAYIINAGTDKLIETGIELYVTSLMPYYEIYGNLSTFIELYKTLSGADTVYVQLNSTVYVETAAGGEIRVTAREGSPVVFTPATGAQGVSVPAGQTALVPASLLPQLQATDAETAQRADAALAQMEVVETAAKGESGSEEEKAGAAAISGGALLLCGGGLLVAVAGLIVGGVVLARRRSTQRPGAAISPPAMRLPAARPSKSAGPPPGRAGAGAGPPAHHSAAGAGPVPGSCLPARSPTSARLVVVQGNLGRPYVDIPPPGLTIGRSAANGLVLNDPQASRQHARLEIATGGWAVRDLGSSNGTYVNGTRVAAQPLHGGEQIQIGETIFTFHPLDH